MSLNIENFWFRQLQYLGDPVQNTLEASQKSVGWSRIPEDKSK